MIGRGLHYLTGRDVPRAAKVNWRRSACLCEDGRTASCLCWFGTKHKHWYVNTFGISWRAINFMQLRCDSAEMEVSFRMIVDNRILDCWNYITIQREKQLNFLSNSLKKLCIVNHGNYQVCIVSNYKFTMTSLTFCFNFHSCKTFYENFIFYNYTILWTSSFSVVSLQPIIVQLSKMKNKKWLNN